MEYFPCGSKTIVLHDVYRVMLDNYTDLSKFEFVLRIFIFVRYVPWYTNEKHTEYQYLNIC